MIAWLAGLLDRFLNWLAPPIQITDVRADDLTDIEEHRECFEPDELWAAHNRFPADSPHFVSEWDAHGGDITGVPPASVWPAGADGHESGASGPST